MTRKPLRSRERLSRGRRAVPEHGERERKRAMGTRRPMLLPDRVNERWSPDFVSDALNDSRRFRALWAPHRGLADRLQYSEAAHLAGRRAAGRLRTTRQARFA